MRDPEFGRRLLADDVRDVGAAMADRVREEARQERQEPGPPVHDDLCTVTEEKGQLRHVFAAGAPNQFWLADITEHKSAEGKLYCHE